MKETLGSRLTAARLGFRPVRSLGRYVRVTHGDDLDPPNPSIVVLELALPAGLPRRAQPANYRVWWEMEGDEALLERVARPHLRPRVVYQRLEIPADTPTK